MSLNFKIQNAVAFVEWDQPQSSANVLSSKFLDDFKSFLDELEKQNIKALVFKSAKPRIFIAGADLKEIRDTHSKQGYQKILQQAHEVLCRFEDLPFPKIALIHGACLGGGTEFALAFDYRLASDSSVTKIGLPEVKLGLIPGFGGCVRLPRLIGLLKGLDLILSGKILSAKKAYRYGLVHEVVPVSILETRGLHLAQEFIKGKRLPSRKYKPKGIVNFLLESFLGRFIIYAKSKSQILKQTKGFYPAPLVALEVVKKTYRFSQIKKALDTEVSYFCEVAVTPESKNLVRLFFLMDEIKKRKTLLSKEKPSSTQPIQRVGVLGAGIMGGGIAYLCSDKGYPARMKDIHQDSFSIAFKQAHRLWKKQKQQRRIDQYEWKERASHLSASLDYKGFSSLDCVIEAITEDVTIKQKVIKECSKHLTESTVFASNTSSLSIEKLSQSYPWPEQFIGMHFFNPVYKMPLVEIIKTEKTSQESVEKIYQFAKSLGKTPIIVKDSPGFVVNRILVPYLTEALWLLDDGKKVKEIDHVFTHQFGLPMGPLRLMDEVGLDVCLKIISIFKDSGLDVDIPSWTDQIEKVLGLGRKTGKGFYIYKKQNLPVNEDIFSLLSPTKKPSFSEEEVKERGLYRLINESLKVWDEGIVNSTEDLDLALILGIGFPPFLGGAIHYAKSVGLQKISKRLKEFSTKWGSRFEPTPAFQKIQS